MAGGDFSRKLQLVLKALSISAGQVAAEVGVDKSVVNRWLRGVSAPTGNNLSRLTAMMAARRAGFSMLDWEADLDRLSMRLRGAGETAKDPADLAAGLGHWLPERVRREALANTDLRGSAYEGFWRTTRPSIEAPGAFMRDFVIMRVGPQGLLTSRIGVEDMGFHGVSFLTQTQLFGVLADPETGIFILSIFNAVLRQRADVIDGLSLTCRRNGGGTPVASRVIMERVGLLSGDPAADDARHDAMTRANDPFTPPEAVPEVVRAHLLKDCGPAAFAQGGEMLLTMAFAESMSRGPRKAGEPFQE